jgi:hypothetical protein
MGVPASFRHMACACACVVGLRNHDRPAESRGDMAAASQTNLLAVLIGLNFGVGTSAAQMDLNAPRASLDFHRGSYRL